MVTAIGYAGILLIQLAIVPAIWQAMQTGQAAPISSILLLILGLLLCFINSVKRFNVVFLLGNVLGLLGNVVLLVSVLLKG